jgi:hypothetical protein
VTVVYVWSDPSGATTLGAGKPAAHGPVHTRSGDSPKVKVPAGASQAVSGERPVGVLVNPNLGAVGIRIGPGPGSS